VDHAVKVILILQMGFIKTDQQKIIKVSGLFLELGDDRGFELSFAGKLVSKQCLTGSVVVVFFGHMESPACSKEQVLLHTGSQVVKVVYFRATI
jgi:hypothetical protein